MTIGNQLKKARQKKQLTIGDVYQKTKISPDILSALEEDNFQKIPNPVYVKSFLREYAGFLGLDIKGLLKEYESTPSAKAPVKNEIDVTYIRPGYNGLNKVMIGKLAKAVFAIVAVFIFVFISFKILSSMRNGFISWNTRRVEKSALKKQAKAVIEKEKVVAEPVVTEKPALRQDNILIPKDQKLDLNITIKDDVWAEIKRDGNIIFTGTFKKGTVRNWQAEESFEIWTGNASMIELSLNGHDLGPVGKGIKRGVIVDRNGIRK
jgi:transcriptional regulator with XRE-family HTH domain